MNVAEIFESLIPSRQKCLERRQALVAANPGKPMEVLARRAIRGATWKGGLIGAGSGVIGNPFAALSLGTVELVAILRAKVLLAGTIAALLDPESLNDEEGFKADVLELLFPSVVSSVLQGAGVHVGQHTSRRLIRKYVSGTVLKEVIRLATKHLGVKLTQRVILTKAVPLFGSLVGATWNVIDLKRLGARALEYHLDHEVPTQEA